jgi:hypothetical protein
LLRGNIFVFFIFILTEPRMPEIYCGSNGGIMNEVKKPRLSLMAGLMGVASFLLVDSKGALPSPLNQMQSRHRVAGRVPIAERDPVVIFNADREGGPVIFFPRNGNRPRVYENIDRFEEEHDIIGEGIQIRSLPHRRFVRLLNSFREREQASTQDRPKVTPNANDTGRQSKWDSYRKWKMICRTIKCFTPVLFIVYTIAEAWLCHSAKMFELTLGHAQEMAKLEKGPMKYFFFKVSNVGGGIHNVAIKAIDAVKSLGRSLVTQPGFWKLWER